MKLKLKFFLLVAFFLLLLTNCFALADTLKVAVAASAQYVFEELRIEFNKESGQNLQGIFNSSGKFTTQIMNAAPYDIFLSADMEFPTKLYKAGYSRNAPQIYCYGALIVWTMKDLDLHNWQSPFNNPLLGKVAIANPRTAPYGRETMRVLAAAKIDKVLQSKLVFGESIAQTNQYIFSSAADIGFTAKSIVLSPELKGKGKWIEVPKELYSPIAQGAIILKHGEESNAKAAHQFYNFLFSAKGRSILERYGYLLP